MCATVQRSKGTSLDLQRLCAAAYGRRHRSVLARCSKISKSTKLVKGNQTAAGIGLTGRSTLLGSLASHGAPQYEHAPDAAPVYAGQPDFTQTAESKPILSVGSTCYVDCASCRQDSFADALGTYLSHELTMTSSPTDKQCISTERAPGAVGPYSQAVKAGSTLFVSGQVGLIPGVSHVCG